MVFPDVLKISRVIPVYKKGDPKSMENYRPISILSVLSKIIETIVKTRLVDFVDRHAIFYARQYGFLHYSNTEAALSILWPHATVGRTQIESWNDVMIFSICLVYLHKNSLNLFENSVVFQNREFYRNKMYFSLVDFTVNIICDAIFKKLKLKLQRELHQANKF
jgi:hypothetical protein